MVLIKCLSFLDVCIENINSTIKINDNIVFTGDVINWYTMKDINQNKSNNAIILKSPAPLNNRNNCEILILKMVIIISAFSCELCVLTLSICKVGDCGFKHIKPLQL